MVVVVWLLRTGNQVGGLLIAPELPYPFMIFVAVVISMIIFRALPTELLQWAANMSNLAALIMPFALMYLISRLPRPAKARW
jgi:hypothetical protein